MKLAKPITPIQPDYKSPYIKYMALSDLYQISNKSDCVVCQREHGTYTVIVHFTNGRFARCTVECIDAWTNYIHVSPDESIAHVEYNIKDYHCYCGEQFFTSFDYFMHLSLEELRHPIRTPATRFVRQHIQCTLCGEYRMIVGLDNMNRGGFCFACYIEKMHVHGGQLSEWGYRIDINQYIEVECYKCHQQFDNVGDYVSHTLLCFNNRAGLSQQVLYQLGKYCMNCYGLLSPVYVKSNHLINCIDCARTTGMRGFMIAKPSLSNETIRAYLAKYTTHLYSDHIRSIINICAGCYSYDPKYRTANDVKICVNCVARRKFSLAGIKYMGIARNLCYICDGKMDPAYKKKSDDCGILFVCNKCALDGTWESC